MHGFEIPQHIIEKGRVIVGDLKARYEANVEERYGDTFILTFQDIKVCVDLDDEGISIRAHQRCHLGGHFLFFRAYLEESELYEDLPIYHEIAKAMKK